MVGENIGIIENRPPQGGRQVCNNGSSYKQKPGSSQGEEGWGWDGVEGSGWVGIRHGQGEYQQRVRGFSQISNQ